MYDYQKLLGKIVEMSGTQASFAKQMGLSEHSLSLKLNNRVYWKQPEINKACDILSIPSEEIPDYFFRLVS